MTTLERKKFKRPGSVAQAPEGAPDGAQQPAPQAPIPFTVGVGITRAESTGGNDTCFVCGKKVFILEKVAVENNVFHKSYGFPAVFSL